MFRKLTALVTALILFISVPVTAFASSGTITGYPNFRSAPSTSSTVYGNLKKGQSVTVLKKVNAYWYQIRANGRTGYVSSKYINVKGGSSSSSKSSSNSSSGSSWSASKRADVILSTARKYLGTPYKFGATYEKDRKFDCSSFVQYVFRQHGTSLPRSTKEQVKYGKAVSKSNLKKGDLVFFTVNGGKSIGHVGIYAGNNRIIHTYGAGGVKYSNINSSYWKKNYVTARRILK